jgi:hypothetical protein
MRSRPPMITAMPTAPSMSEIGFKRLDELLASQPSA